MTARWTVTYYARQNGEGGSSHYTIRAGPVAIARTAAQVATDEDERRAYLMAGAPELLAALERIIREFEGATTLLSQDLADAIQVFGKEAIAGARPPQLDLFR